MFCVSFFLSWISRDLKIKNEYEKRRRAKSIEQIANDEADGRIESFEPKTPFIYRIIEYWSFLENLAWIIILITKPNTDFPDNFLHGFCDGGVCDSAITKAIIIRLSVGVLLLVGCKIVSGFVHMI